MDMTRLILALLACCVCFSVSSKDFTRFSTAKKHLIKTLPHNAKSLYCGCDIKKQGKRLYGTGLNVQSPEILKDLDNPIVILKTGIYSQEIKSQILSINSSVQFL